MRGLVYQGSRIPAMGYEIPSFSFPILLGNTWEKESHGMKYDSIRSLKPRKLTNT